MKVCRVFRIVDADLVADDPLPAKFGFAMPDIVGPLTHIQSVHGADARLSLELLLSEGNKRQHVSLELEPFLLPREILHSQDSPLCFHDLSVVALQPALPLKPGRWLWLFRNGLYMTERPVRPSETEEVQLAIKVRHYRDDEQLKRLRAQVANFEALEGARSGGTQRGRLRDDVRLLVWARDGGRCVQCNADQDLQFDHIIPFARGGSDESANVQLLCRTCNLKKTDRIA